MKGSHFLWISTAHGVVFTFLLGLLHVFKFISWNPLNWTKRMQILPDVHSSVKWFLTFIIIIIITNVVVGLLLLIKKAPPIATSILVGFIIWLVLEWSIHQDFSDIKWNSIPTLVTILIISRALAETIHYYNREVYDDKGK